MIESVYNNFGFVGSLFVSLALFFFFIFWMAGVAGLCENRKYGRFQSLVLLVAILIPVYPVGWIVWEMIDQKRQLKKL